MARDVEVDVLANDKTARATRTAASGFADLDKKVKETTRDLDKSVATWGKVGADGSAALGHVQRAAKQLDREIDGLTRSLVELTAAQALTDRDTDKWRDITKEIRKQETALRSLKRSRNRISASDLLPKPGEVADVSKMVGSQTIRNIGQTIAAGGPIVKVAIAGVMAGSAPIIASAISGAVTAGLASGAVAGGVVLAFRDPKVQAAGKSLAAEVKTDLTDAASGFVAPTLKGLAIVKGAWTDVRGDVRGIFDSASRFVEPLARGIAGFTRNVIPGIRDAVASAGPVVAALSGELPKIGDAVSDALRSISKNSDDAAGGLQLVSQTVQSIIRGGGSLIGTLTGWFSGFVAVADAGLKVREAMFWLPDFVGNVDETRAKIDELQNTMGTGTAAFRTLKTETQLTGEAARKSAADMRGFADAVRDQQKALLGAANSQIAFEQAIDDATAAGKKNNDGIDVNTAKGRANKELLLQLAGATQSYAQDLFDATGDQDAATAATERGRTKFLAAATAMHVGSKEAKELANKLFGLPKETKPKVTIDQGPAKTAVQQIQEKINGLKGKHIPITFDTVLGQSSISLGNLLHEHPGRAAGGLIGGHGTGTSDSNLAWLSKGEFVVRNAAVRALGVDFLEQLNDIGPGSGSRSFLNVPMPTGGGSASPAPASSVPLIVENHIEIGGEVVRVVRTEITSANRGLRRGATAGAGARR